MSNNCHAQIRGAGARVQPTKPELSPGVCHVSLLLTEDMLGEEPLGDAQHPRHCWAGCRLGASASNPPSEAQFSSRARSVPIEHH